ncbi:MAG: ribonuclease III [Rhodospirillales bacterium]|nr:ribonuclease III [Rhodospirillales bacterium]
MSDAGDGRNALESALGHVFRDRDLLTQALTHSSTAGGGWPRSPSNERLEFLGDRVLGLVVAELLFRKFQGEPEGGLASRFTALTRRETLAQVAAAIGLAPHMIMSPGEEEMGGRRNPALLSDTCEAVIAALYLDGGFETASRFIERHWAPLLDAYPTAPKDAKTALQEWAQGRGLALPEYRERGREGPSHAPTFSIEVAVAGQEPAVGVGASKRVAEQAAAQILLDRIREGQSAGGDGG